MSSRQNHQDIRIGTLAPMDKGADYLRQVVPHGFESFELTLWQYVGGVDLEKTAKECLDAVAGEAEISFIAIKPGSYHLKVPGSTGDTQQVSITIE